MIFILSLLLFVSIVINIILVWYTRKLVQNLFYGVNNVDELQKLLNEYVDLLKPIVDMENYYADPAITAAINNTKLIIDACKVYKNTIIESDDEEIQEKEVAETKKETINKTQATISKIN